jgi:hypothetical protein
MKTLRLWGMKLVPRKGKVVVKNGDGLLLKNLDGSVAHFSTADNAMTALRYMDIDHKYEFWSVLR